MKSRRNATAILSSVMLCTAAWLPQCAHGQASVVKKLVGRLDLDRDSVVTDVSISGYATTEQV